MNPKLKILILDEGDNWCLYNVLLRKYLSTCEVEFRVTSGKATLKLDATFDLIIIDGIGLINAIRFVQRLQPATPILFVSAMPDNLTAWLKQEGLQVFATLPKPFAISEFCEIICRALRIPIGKTGRPIDQGGRMMPGHTP